MLLSVYRQSVVDILNDPTNAFYSVTLLNRFINRARSQVSKRAQCVRLLTPGSASVTSYTVTAGGSGYTSPPTVTVTGPDMIQGPAFITATGTAVLTGNAVTSITLGTGGSGYVKAPTVTLSGGGGTGATATATLGTHFTTTAGVELYTFAAAATSLANTAVKGIVDILGLSAAYSGTKLTLNECSFTELQAYVRSFSMGQMYPVIWAKYAQGESGSFYLGPVPGDQYAIEADCVCTPVDLVDDTTVDLIPDAWNEAVFYYAAFLAYQNAARTDDAKMAFSEYDRLLMTARGSTTSVMIPSLYGDGW